MKNLKESGQGLLTGGEEFLLVLPNRTTEEAARGVDRFRRMVAERGGRNQVVVDPSSVPD